MSTLRKKTLWKDIKKCISKSRGRFISIASLIALGSFALVGLQVTGPDMRKTGSAYFEAYNTADITILGDYGIDENNQLAINKASNIETVEYGYLKDVTIRDTLTSIRIFSNTDTLSQYELVEGRMPQIENEISLASFFEGDYQIGDLISFDEKANSTGETVLKRHTFRIVGFVNSTELLSEVNLGNSTAGTGELSGYAVVIPETFDSSVYMIARLSFTDTQGLDPYSDAYTEVITSHKEELDALLADQPELRLSSIKEEYQEEIDDGQKQIDDAKQELADAKDQLTDARITLDEGYADLADAKQELNTKVADAEEEINENQTTIDNAIVTLQNGEKEANEAKNKLDEAEAQLTFAKATLEENRIKLDTAKATLIAAESELATARATLDAGWDSLVSTVNTAIGNGSLTKEQILSLAEGTDSITEEAATQATAAIATYQTLAGRVQSGETLTAEEQAQFQTLQENLNTYQTVLITYQLKSNTEFMSSYAALQAGETEYEQKLAEYNAAKAEYEVGEQQYAQGLSEYNSGLATFEESQAAYYSAVTEIESGWAEVNNGKAELEDARNTLATEKADALSEIADAQKELADGENEYADKLAEYNEKEPDALKEIQDAEEELKDAQETVDGLSLPVYTLDTRREIPGAEGYKVYGTIADIVDSLADVFPIFLYFVAALVTLTTMTRFVDEERINCGTLKALGYDNRDIMKKFIVYGFGASTIGAVAGIALGHTLMPMIVYNAYGHSFTYPKLQLYFYPGISLIALLLAYISAVLPAYLVSRNSLKEKPAALLLPKPPANGSKILLESITPIWNRMSFTHKVTARNLFRYKKRMAMTIFGVCGAVTLIFAGFSVQHSIAGINDRQFGELIKYDLIVARNSSINVEEEEELESLLNGESVKQQAPIVYEELNKIAGDNQDKQEITLLVPKEEDTFSDFMELCERKSGNFISLSDDGAVITERLADLLDVKIGDSFTVNDSNNNEYTVRVSAISEMYTGHFIFMNSSYYEEVFSKEYKTNANLVKLTDSSTENDRIQAAEFMKLDAVKGVVQNTTMTGQIDTIVQALNKIMTVLIIVAIMLAAVILYNLTNINVSERIRELSTIKVLGFFDEEVTMYIYRETILLTALGILVGFLGGDILYQYILDVVPPDAVMFNPALGAKAFVIPTLVVSLITVILGFKIHHRLQNVDMLEALKSVD